MLTIIKPDKSKPHVITDGEGERTHYLGEVHMKIASSAQPTRKIEEVKYNV